MEQCSFCKRETPNLYLEKHHLIPRCEGGKEKVPACIDCGDQIHQLFTEHELRDKYNTVEKLLANENVRRWIRWVRRRGFGVCMKAKKRK